MINHKITAIVYENDLLSFILLPLLGDVSELLLDRVSVNIGEAESASGGSGKTAPLSRVPTGRGHPNTVHAGGLDFLDGLLDGIEASKKSRVRLREADVQQLSVVVFVLHDFEVGGGGTEENHFDRCRRVWAALRRRVEERRKTKGMSFGSDRKTPPFVGQDSA